MAGAAFHDHASAVRLRNMLHDAQANPHAFGFASKLRAVAIKEIENLLLLFGGNSRAAVDYPEPDSLGQDFRFDANLRAGWRMLDRVIEQVHHALFHGFTVP